jgi:hypothetical protein
MNFSDGGKSAQINAGIEKVQNQYGWGGGSCIQLDKLIKDVSDRIVLERGRFGDEYYLRALLNHKIALELIFSSNSCADKIETLRQKESAVLITKQSIEQEKSVLNSANTDQRIYIGAGALILLVGLYVLLKK